MKRGLFMDKLDEVFKLQEQLDNDIISRRNLQGIDNYEWIQKEVLAIISELAELLDEVNFKWWKNPKKVNPDALKEEVVDLFHFFISICLKAGLTSDELYELYKLKNLENFRRQRGKSTKKGYFLDADQE